MWCCFYLSEVLSKCNKNGGMPTLDECFSGCHVAEKKSLDFNDHVTWTLFPLSFVYILIRITLFTHNFFFKISVNTFSCSWPEAKYGNWIPK